MMRHNLKTHGSHCYLRSYKTSCPSCGKDVLYWECTHGCKVFFEYPPYGKLIKHRCKKYKTKDQRKKYKVIVKPPKGLSENPSPRCKACGKYFSTEYDLKAHINQLKDFDLIHMDIYGKENRTILKKNQVDKKEKFNMHYKPEFGKINFRKSKK
ncbi:MAG: hypothetical protein EU548_05375 [Promethearchaeota archaeon]|nr:MAG: hypothetical protein EU548_05375 [Candidatus Lokiarchaeota archaeon]